MQIESRGELQDLIAKNAASDAAYRSKLLAEPKSLLEKHMGRNLPEWLNVEVVEEKANTLYLIAPHVPSEELSDDDLEMVAGGKGGGGGTGMQTGDVECHNNYGAFNSVVNVNSEVSVI